MEFFTPFWCLTLSHAKPSLERTESTLLLPTPNRTSQSSREPVMGPSKAGGVCEHGFRNQFRVQIPTSSTMIYSVRF